MQRPSSEAAISNTGPSAEPGAENSEGRPLAGAASNAGSTDIHSVPRCTHCGHVLFSAISIKIGVGRDCRRGRSLAVAA